MNATTTTPPKPPTILERVSSLAAGDAHEVYSNVATILRKLASDTSATDKAAALWNVLRRFGDADQVRILAAVEMLAGRP